MGTKKTRQNETKGMDLIKFRQFSLRAIFSQLLKPVDSFSWTPLELEWSRTFVFAFFVPQLKRSSDEIGEREKETGRGKWPQGTTRALSSHGIAAPVRHTNPQLSSTRTRPCPTVRGAHKMFPLTSSGKQAMVHRKMVH